jgi:hypothetical protein
MGRNGSALEVGHIVLQMRGIIKPENDELFSMEMDVTVVTPAHNIGMAIGQMACS